ncbi:MAG: hypothetical protein IPJ13_23155 [Saprospiraceae bacterium]|nr:hypothetical protein [Saprospiraceae bacterium]
MTHDFRGKHPRRLLSKEDAFDNCIDDVQNYLISAESDLVLNRQRQLLESSSGNRLKFTSFQIFQ